MSEGDLAQTLANNKHLRVVGEPHGGKLLKTGTGDEDDPIVWHGSKPDPDLPPAKGQIRPRKMNKAEAQYADHLELRKKAGEISWYDFEAITLRLGDDCRYTPDFPVMLATGHFEFHEFKGHWEDDAKVKIRVAADLYPMFRFVAIQAIPKKAGGGWKETDFSRDAVEVDAPAMLASAVQPQVEKKARKPKAPVDPRKDHPAIKAILGVTARYPPKPIWDVLIEAVGDIPNVPLMEELYRRWLVIGSPTNFTWVTQWYRKGGVCDIRGNLLAKTADNLSARDDRLFDPDDKSWQKDTDFAVVIEAQEALLEHVYRDRSGYEHWKAGWLKDRPQDTGLVEEYERSTRFRQRFGSQG